MFFLQKMTFVGGIKKPQHPPFPTIYQPKNIRTPINHMAMGPGTLVNIKIAGKWMVIPPTYGTVVATSISFIPISFPTGVNLQFLRRKRCGKATM